jgi:hypothetical protein
MVTVLTFPLTHSLPRDSCQGWSWIREVVSLTPREGDKKQAHSDVTDQWGAGGLEPSLCSAATSDFCLPKFTGKRGSVDSLMSLLLAGLCGPGWVGSTLLRSHKRMAFGRTKATDWCLVTGERQNRPWWQWRRKKSHFEGYTYCWLYHRKQSSGCLWQVWELKIIL